jgi:hypothetical protein
MNSTFTMPHMRKFTIMLFSLWGIMNTLNAQAPEWLWAKANGGPGNDYIFSSAIDPSGNGEVYNAGYFEGTVDFDPGEETLNLTSNGLWDMFLTKMDASGNLIWARAFGGVDYDYGISIATDESGNVYFAGAFVGTVDFDPGAGTNELTSVGVIDIVLLRFDADGNLSWAKSIGGDGINFVQSMVLNQDANGGICATGRYNGTTDFDPDPSNETNLTAQDFDIFTFKVDAAGNLVWARSFGSPGFDVGYAVAVDPTGSGDVYTTGSFRGTVDFDPDSAGVFNLVCTGNQCLFLYKLDVNGDFVWAKAIRGPNNAYGKGLALDPHSGDVYITGLFNGKVDFDPGTEIFFITGNGYDLFVTKLNVAGDFLWTKSFGAEGFDFGSSIAIDPGGSGDVYTLGYYSGTVDFDPGIDEFNQTSNGGDDSFISKLDESGNFLWAKSFGGELGDYGGSIMSDQSGQVYVSGYYLSSPFSFDSTTILNSDKSQTTYEFFVAKLEGGLSSWTADISELPLALYPNPATNTVTITLPEMESMQGQITIYNSVGKICLNHAEQELGLQHAIDIRTLPTGTYFISVEAKGVKHTGTFSKI